MRLRGMWLVSRGTAGLTLFAFKDGVLNAWKRRRQERAKLATDITVRTMIGSHIMISVLLLPGLVFRMLF